MQNPQKAAEFVRRGAAGCHPVGIGLLARYSLHGHNMSVNLSLGFKIAKKAAEMGGAVNTLALCYEQ